MLVGGGGGAAAPARYLAGVGASGRLGRRNGQAAKPQEVLSAADVGGVGESRTVVLALAEPPARGEGRRIDDGSASDAAEAIVEFLAEKRVL